MITNLKWVANDIIKVLLDNGEEKFCQWPNNKTWIDEAIHKAIDSGIEIEDKDPLPPPTQDELDKQQAQQYTKLQALRNMTPTQVDAWIETNINTFAQAKDALKTLAIAVSVLARQL